MTRPVATTCVVLVLAVGVVLRGHAAGLVCFSQGSGGPPVVSQGPVTIGTDHSVYAPSDTITVTVTNHLDHPIVLVPPDSYSGTCPWIFLSKLDSGPLNPCTSGTDVMPSRHVYLLPAGDTTGDVFSNTNFNLATSLSDGTYQVSTQYVVPNADGHLPPLGDAIGLASPTFRVCTCRIC